MAAELTPLHKRALFEDGYVVLSGAITPPLVADARAQMAAAGKHTYQDEALETSAEFCDLVNKSSLTPILREAMGPFDPPSRGFAATIFPQASNGTLVLGTDASKDANESDYNVQPYAHRASRCARAGGRRAWRPERGAPVYCQAAQDLGSVLKKLTSPLTTHQQN
jgi:hypothetical protein